MLDQLPEFGHRPRHFPQRADDRGGRQGQGRLAATAQVDQPLRQVPRFLRLVAVGHKRQQADQFRIAAGPAPFVPVQELEDRLDLEGGELGLLPGRRRSIRRTD